MTDIELKIITAALLHDIGKVVYRAGQKKKHSELGYDFLKNDVALNEKDILNAVRYHHGTELGRVKLEKDALAYIIYIADNIAASDRRKNENEEYGFDKSIPLDTIFNILNNNRDSKHYLPTVLEEKKTPNMPTDAKTEFYSEFYEQIRSKMVDTIKGIDNLKNEYINSLLSVMEAYLSYIPSSTAIGELSDISLYDHLKMTAAYSSCIYQYLKERKIVDFKKQLYSNAKDFYNEKAFLLFSMDISGIQQFIYTIHSEKALRMLRSRSFYLEILMEHMIDEILEACNLSRANLIYSGGGHCYMLLPNTQEVKTVVRNKKEEFDDFFLEEYDISLFVAVGMTACSASELANKPEGSYRDLFGKLSTEISDQKMCRYSPTQIKYLNRTKLQDSSRECKVCKRSSHLNKENICNFCNSMISFSTDVLYEQFFSVFMEKSEKQNSILLPGKKYLIAQDRNALTHSMEKDDYFVRTYVKNRFFTGSSVATKLWVGDYTNQNTTTEEYAKNATGIDRIAVVRADVDNLGQAFVSGFPDKYTTLSRTASFSRQLSLYFKHHINYILEHGEFGFCESGKERKVSIVYSGGDDIFLVGAWDDAIEAAIDIRNKLKEYSANTLSISAGIGIYGAKYPLSVAAAEVAELESRAKEHPNKNAVSLLGKTFSWDVFIEKVVKEKENLLEHFFSYDTERGKAFLYRLLDLIRNMNDTDRINLARFAYVLARLQPDENASREAKVSYQDFMKKMYSWVQNKDDREQLEIAVILYVYRHREKEGEE